LSRGPIAVKPALKGKEKLFLYLIKFQDIKTHGGVEGYLYEYLTSARFVKCSPIKTCGRVEVQLHHSLP
jgi:hypothetical protein